MKPGPFAVVHWVAAFGILNAFGRSARLAATRRHGDIYVSSCRRVASGSGRFGNSATEEQSPGNERKLMYLRLQ